MREIKFRAFNKSLKIMHEVSSINFTYKEIIVDTFDDYWELDFKDVELMQYAGLRDKNGKEIYEGDIVEYVKNGLYNKGYVVFDYGAFMIKDDSNVLKRIDHLKNAVVVGNIYENKELLDENH